MWSCLCSYVLNLFDTLAGLRRATKSVPESPPPALEDLSYRQMCHVFLFIWAMCCVVIYRSYQQHTSALCSSAPCLVWWQEEGDIREDFRQWQEEQLLLQENSNMNKHAKLHSLVLKTKNE